MIINFLKNRKKKYDHPPENKRVVEAGKPFVHRTGQHSFPELLGKEIEVIERPVDPRFKDEFNTAKYMMGNKDKIKYPES